VRTTEIGNVQRSLFEEPLAAEVWDQDSARRALDELFTVARQYSSSAAYFELMRFIASFRAYAPFNAMLVHVQMPGARYVAPAHRWASEYCRRIRPDARPLVILQPMGPVMFVFDVSDTEPEPGAPPLPPEVENPFEVRRGRVGDELRQTVENAKRDGIRVTSQQAGAGSAGSIRAANTSQRLEFRTKTRPKPEHVEVPLRYELLVNARHSAEAQYATLVHELAHLYCGHLGSPDPRWWPDRMGLPNQVGEFEAESVCYLICARVGLDNPSAEYLAQYVEDHGETPPISLDCVMKAAGLIEQMGRQRLEPRPTKSKQ